MSAILRYRLGLGAEVRRPMRHLGGVADFSALINPNSPTFSPTFAAGWEDVKAQLTIEGEGAVSTVNQYVPGGVTTVQQVLDLSGAQGAMADAYTQISGAAFRISDNVQECVDAAKKYVIIGQTVLGAVNTLAGIVALPGVERDKAMLGLTGTMFSTLTTVAIGAGAVSAGLGAAIVLGAGAILSVMQANGWVGGKPPPAGTICGFPFNVKPDFVVECLGGWGPIIQPGSLNWRPFPDPKDPADAVWFEGGSRHVGPGNWRGAFYGVLGPGVDQSYSKNGVPNPASNDERPIDIAFNGYSAFVENHVVYGPPGFSDAFAAAWKANAAYALNGLAPQPEWAVLVHVLRMWNRAHQGPSVFVGAPSWLITLALDNLSGDPLIGTASDGSHSLLVNVGAVKNPGATAMAVSVLGGVTSGSAAKTAAKTAGTVAAAGVIGTLAYSYVTGHAVNLVVKHGWAAMTNFWRMVVGDAERAVGMRRANPLMRRRRRARR